jgi:hypothetical protein
MQNKNDNARTDGREMHTRQPMDAHHKAEPHPAPQNMAPQQNMMGDLPATESNDRFGRERDQTRLNRDQQQGRDDVPTD